MSNGVMVNEAAARYLGADHGLFIDGKVSPALSGRVFDTYDPATGKVIARVAEGDALDVDLAVKAAQRSLEDKSWMRLGAEARGKVLWRLADLLDQYMPELSHLEVLNNGMPLGFATWSVNASASWLRYYAGAISRISGKTAGDGINEPGRTIHAYTMRQPIGVVGLIVPWNAPIANFFIKVAPALAAGCSVVVKPAESTPITALRVAELALEAGVPAGVLNVVAGYGGTAGAALVRHPGVHKISFTGSTNVGKQIVQASAGNLKRLTLELGGKSPCIICDDADLEIAIPGAAMAILANSGQVCFAGSRLYAQRKVFDKVVGGIADFAAKLQLGSGFDPNTALGPLISERQCRSVAEYIELGRKEGAQIAYCGKTPEGSGGFFSPPTIIVNATDKMRVSREEIFGPVLVATPIDDLDEIVRHANDSRYGLGAGVFTGDVNKAHRLAERLQVGNVWINCYGVVHPTMPFGGFKESGWGREMSTEGLDAFLEIKSVFLHLH